MIILWFRITEFHQSFKTIMSKQSAQQPVPSSRSILDKDLGKKFIGPLKRHIGKTVDDANEWCRNCELLIQGFANPDQEPTESEISLMKEYVAKLHQHRNNLQGIPRQVERKLSEPAVLRSSRRDEFAAGIEKHLETVEYRRTLSKISTILGMFEQEFHSRDIPMDDATHRNQSPEPTNYVQVSDGEGDGNGSTAGSTPVTYNSTHEQFLYEGADHLGQHLSYREELERRAAELSADSQDLSRLTVPSGGAPEESNGLISPMEPSKVVPQLPERKVQEPQNLLQNSQTESKQGVPPEFMEEILLNIQRIQLEKDETRKRENHLIRLELEALHKENQSMKMELEASKADQAKFSEHDKYSTKSSTKSEKFAREQKPKQKAEPAKLRFTSSSEASEGETYYDEQESSQYDSEAGYTTAQSEFQPHSRLSEKRIPLTKASRHRPRQATFDEVKKILISFDGTGRFDTFQKLFYAQVMENDNITPFMRAVLLEENLKGAASRYFYQLEDPTESIEKTFKDLNKKYGRKATEMSLHEKFYSLPFHKYDCEQMVTDVAEHRKVMAQLEEKKVNINDTRSITAFTRKLPRSLNEKVMRYLTVTKARKVTFDKVLDICEKEIEILHTSKAVFGEKKGQGSNEIMDPYVATIHHANTQPHQNNYQYQQNIGRDTQGHQNPNNQNSKQQGNPRHPGNPSQRGYNNGKNSSPMNQHPSQNPYDSGIPTPNWGLVSWSFPFGTHEVGQKCAACDGPHKSIRCPLSSSEFRKRIHAKNLCHRCTLSGHKTTDCPKSSKCGYCRGAHCMGGCPMKEKYRNRANLPASCIIKDENSPKQPFRKQGRTGNSQ